MAAATKIRVRWREQLVLHPELAKIDSWPDPDISHLSSENQAQYKLRLAAVEAVLLGASVASAAVLLKTSQGELYRLLKKCLESDADDEPALKLGLVPEARLDGYNRTASADGLQQGLSGAFKQLLARDDLENVFDQTREDIKRVLQRKADAALLRHKGVHQKWLLRLKGAGVKDNEYPFSATPGKGSDSLRRWWKKTKLEILAQRGRDKSYENALSGDPLYEVMDCFEFDEHKEDFQATLAIRTDDGIVKIRCARIWVLAIVERRSTATFGLTWGLSSQPRQDDVLECLNDAVTPWVPFTDLPGRLEYPPDSGAPSVIPELRWAIPYFFLVDNHLSHFGKVIQKYIHKAWKCVLNMGRPHFSVARRVVEMLWARIAEIEHQFPSTTGNNPFDARRDPHPERAPLVYLQDLPAILDVIRATLNVEKREDLLLRSPLQYLRDAIQNGLIVRHLPPEYRNSAAPHRVQLSLPVRGDLEHHVDLHVHYLYDRYTGPALKEAVGSGATHVTVEYDRRDIRFFDVIGPEGKPLGQLKKQGTFAGFPHDERLRRVFARLGREEGLSEAAALSSYFEALGKVPRGPRDALKLFDVITRILKGDGNPEHQLPPDEDESSKPDAVPALPPPKQGFKWEPHVAPPP